jgi:RNA polymerase sigma-70 factor (ECF subfamily)
MTTDTPERPTPEVLDDIVLRTRGGDRRAMEEIILYLQSELRVFIAARAGSLDMVEDVLQGTFVTCFRVLDTYEPRGTFVAWLKGIAKNLLLKEFKERSRYAAVEGSALEEMVIHHRLEAIDREEGREAARETARLLECMDRLPDRTRELVRRRYWDRAPVKTLARQFKKRAGTIAGILRRARHSLLLCMEADGESS